MWHRKRCLAGGLLGSLFGNVALSDIDRLSRTPRPAAAVLPELPHARLPPQLAAQVVELGPVDVADRGDLDSLDLRRMERKRPLDADPEGLLAHGERLPRPGSLALQDDALEDLDPLPLALDHLEVHAHGVPSLELRQVVAHLGAFECLDHLAHRDGFVRSSIWVDRSFRTDARAEPVRPEDGTASGASGNAARGPPRNASGSGRLRPGPPTPRQIPPSMDSSSHFRRELQV